MIHLNSTQKFLRIQEKVSTRFDWVLFLLLYRCEIMQKNTCGMIHSCLVLWPFSVILVYHLMVARCPSVQTIYVQMLIRSSFVWKYGLICEEVCMIQTRQLKCVMSEFQL